MLASNDNWKESQQAEIEETTIPPTNGMESAIVRTLPPGAYTAILRGKNNLTGIGLIEGQKSLPSFGATCVDRHRSGFSDSARLLQKSVTPVSKACRLLLILSPRSTDSNSRFRGSGEVPTSPRREFPHRTIFPAAISSGRAGQRRPLVGQVNVTCPRVPLSL